MRWPWWVFLAAAGLVCAIFAHGFAETEVEDLLSKMIEDRGGRAVLSELRTTIMKGTVTFVSQGGVSGNFTETHMYPDKSLIEMGVAGTVITQGLCGELAWADNPLAGGYQELTSEEKDYMKRDALGDYAYLDPEAYGVTYKYMGMDTDGGAEFHVLEQLLGTTKATIYVHPESYQIHKVAVSKGTPPQAYLEEIYYSDYRKTAGIMRPHRVVLLVAGQETISILFDRVEHNVPLDASLFEGAEPRFTRAELIADARQLAAIIEDTHPDPYVHIGGKIAFHRRLQHVLHAIPAEGMTKNGFKTLLRPFVAAIGDGHTEVFAYHNVNTAAPGGIPLKFDAVGQSLIVTGVPHEQYRQLLGARLSSVEGIAVDELGRRLSNLRPIDNQYHLLWYFTANYLRYGPFLSELLPEWQDSGHLRARFTLRSGEVAQVTFALPMAASSMIGPESRISLPSPDASGFVYDFIGPGDRIAYLRIDHMKYYRESLEVRNSLGLEAAPQEKLDSMPSVTEFFRSLVTTMKDAGTKTMIVDLRRNEGGDALMVDFIMYFLYGKDTTLQTQWGNITRLSKVYLEARDSSTLDNLNQNRAIRLAEGDYDFSGDYSDEVLGVTSTMDESFAHSATFAAEWGSGAYEGYYCPANVIVLTRPWTYSAGFGVAVRLYRAGAILVGTPSSQAPNSGANAAPWKLSNSGVEGRVAQSYVLNFPEDSEWSRVLPVHYPVTDDVLSSYSFDPNVEVLYAIDLLADIEKQKK